VGKSGESFLRELNADGTYTCGDYRKSGESIFKILPRIDESPIALMTAIG